MGADSAIQWTHHTFNPWRGCSKVHTGCKNCYAERDRSVRLHGVKWGTLAQGGTRPVKAESGWREPFTWARKAAAAGERHRVFCSSLADVLDADAPPEAQQRLWQVIRETASVCGRCGTFAHTQQQVARCGPASWDSGLDWLLLTKRPERWQLVPEDVRPLVWLGTSIADQQTADEWVPRLLMAEGFRLRFLSLEPMVGPVDLTRLKIPDAPSPPWHGNALHAYRGFGARLDWVIVGGESQSGARPCKPEWVHSVVQQCQEAKVPVFVKQMGEVWARDVGALDKKGGDPDEWPAPLRVRQFPEVSP